jgi:hypothetical protein
MIRTPVASSSLVSVGYDEQHQILEIEFRRTAIYQYARVPKTLYEQLIASSSKGRFFDQRIRDKFSTTKIS